MTAALDALVASLDLERIEVNIYRGAAPANGLRVFGGRVAAQALVAAGRTVGEPDRAVHSLHAYFLRPGDPSLPILYEVDRIRDGRSFTTRRVAAIQRGEAIFHLSASWHVHEEGVAHQSPVPPAPDPETLPDWDARHAAEYLAAGPPADPGGPTPDPQADTGAGEGVAPSPVAGLTPAEPTRRPRRLPIDVRHVGAPVRTGRGSPVRPPEHVMWLRADGRLDDDPLLHTCVIAYASDLTLLDTMMLPHGLIWDDPDATQLSLDHAMWVHRPVRADDWLLYTQRSPIAAGGRGLAVGTIWTRTGELAVTVVQEGLLRTRRPTAV